MRKELAEMLNDVSSEMEAIVATAQAENRAVTAEEIEKFNALKEKAEEIQNTIEMENYVMENKTFVPEPTAVKDTAELEVKAFADYLRGIKNQDVPTTKGDNGALVPSTIANKIIDKVYQLSPIFARAERFNVKGTLNIPYVDQATTTLAVAYATEFTDVEAKAVKTQQIQLTGYIAMALAQVSKSLVNNSQFDIISFVVDKIALEFAKFIDKELIKGTSSKIAGLAAGVTAKVTAASATAITADELISVQDLVPDAYQADACWIMAPATRSAIRKLKDGEGNYLLIPDFRAGGAWTLLGKPVFVSENMDGISTGKTSVYYGDMSGLAVKVSEEMNVEVLREKYATAHAIGVVASMELDAKVQDASKLAKLVQA